MGNYNFGELETKYCLPLDFVKELHEKVIDKNNFERALRMFKNGTLKYEIATGKKPINIAEIRNEIAGNFHSVRNNVRQQMEQQRKVVEYYNGCMALTYYHKPKRGIRDVVFIKDGHLVAFAHFEPKQGGIYAANNEVMPSFRWNPHEHLARLRKLNKAFYREVKKAAFADDKELFNFNIQ